MADRRYKDHPWGVADDAGNVYTAVREGVLVAVLLDLRDELKRINARLDCHEFISIPRILRRISANTAKPRRRRRRA